MRCSNVSKATTFEVINSTLILMSQPYRQILSLWDYGWLDYNEIRLPPCNQPRQLIDAYLNDEGFGTSFVGRELDREPAIHGPFRRTLITANDFQIVDFNILYTQIRRVRQWQGSDEPPDEAQWLAVENLLTILGSRYRWFFMLRLTEEDADKFHDWGFVLWLFREFLLANPNSENTARLVFGFD